MVDNREVLDRIKELSGSLTESHRDLIGETRGLAKTVSRVDKRVAVLEERSTHVATNTQVINAVKEGLRQHSDECVGNKRSLIPKPVKQLDLVQLAKIIGLAIAAMAAALGGYHIGG